MPYAASVGVPGPGPRRVPGVGSWTSWVGGAPGRPGLRARPRALSTPDVMGRREMWGRQGPTPGVRRGWSDLELARPTPEGQDSELEFTGRPGPGVRGGDVRSNTRRRELGAKGGVASCVASRHRHRSSRRPRTAHDVAAIARWLARPGGRVQVGAGPGWSDVGPLGTSTPTDGLSTGTGGRTAPSGLRAPSPGTPGPRSRTLRG